MNRFVVLQALCSLLRVLTSLYYLGSLGSAMAPTLSSLRTLSSVAATPSATPLWPAYAMDGSGKG